jgi:hypothetical protein
MITKAQVQIGGTFDGDPEALVYELKDEASFWAYEKAETNLRLAQVARDKALGAPVKWPIGICSFWITNVRLTKDGNQYIPAGTVGDLNVVEVSTDRKIIEAKFYPEGDGGFGMVVMPEYEKL